MSETTEIRISETLHIETPPETPPEPRPLSRRDEQMIAIAARREEAINRELAHGVLMEDEAREAGGGQPIEREAPAPEEPPEAPEPPPFAAAPTVPAAPAQPALREVNLGGQSYYVSETEHNRLAALGAITQTALSQQPREAPAQAAPVHTVPPSPAAMDPEAAKGIFRRMTYGNEEDGAAALQDLANMMAQRSGPQVDPRQLVAFATQQAIQQIELKNNLQTVLGEYPDIFGPTDRRVSDPAEIKHFKRLSQQSALILDDIRREDAMVGRQRTDLELYREALSQTRATFVRPTSPAPSAVPPQAAPQAAAVAPSQERLDRKRAAPRQPSAVSRVASSGEEPRQFPTKSEVVAQMARARGQQTPVSTR